MREIPIEVPQQAVEPPARQAGITSLIARQEAAAQWW